MQRDPRAWLWDVREAAQAIELFVAGLDATGYAQSELVHSAVERKFEVIVRERCEEPPVTVEMQPIGAYEAMDAGSSPA